MTQKMYYYFFYGLLCALFVSSNLHAQVWDYQTGSVTVPSQDGVITLRSKVATSNSPYTTADMISLDFGKVFKSLEKPAGFINTMANQGYVKLSVFSYSETASDRKGPLVFGIKSTQNGKYAGDTWNYAFNIVGNPTDRPEYVTIQVKSDQIKMLSQGQQVYSTEGCREYAISLQNLITGLGNVFFGTIAFVSSWGQLDVKAPLKCSEAWQGKQPVIVELEIKDATVASVSIPGIGELLPTTLFLNRDSRNKIRDLFLNPTKYPDYTMVSFHRGLWQNYPENSLEALQEAADNGAQIIELDVKVSSDNVPYLMHDDYIYRTTNANTADGKGRYDQYTVAEIKDLKLKDKNGNVTEYTVPTLEDVLKHFATSNVLLALDPGNHGELVENFLEQSVALDDQYQTLDYVIFKSKLSVADFMAGPLSKVPAVKQSRLLYVPICSSDDATVLDFYNLWKNQSYARAFELSQKNNSDYPNSMTVTNLVKASDKRVQMFSTWPEACRGRYDGREPINWCCNDVDGDLKGDWNFLTQTVGATLIISDRPYLLNQYLYAVGQRPD
ncbi:MAG: glycerophosphodiester phosphodiesterase family protein [Microscillaceae bacterium]|nr:glycerophosphodiester phosphodiesterase family protein [Microscillaceae bacterium]